MKLKNLFIVQAIVALFNGGMLLIVPAFYLSFFGITDPSQETILISRLLGAELFGYSVIAWLARDSMESKSRTAIVTGLCAGNVVGFIAALIGQLAGIPNAMGWIIVALYLLLALAFGYFLLVADSE